MSNTPKPMSSTEQPDVTVLMATHDTSIVDQFRKRVVQLHEGRVVRDQAEGGYRQVVAP